MTLSKRLNVADNFCVDACATAKWGAHERRRESKKKNGSKMQGGSFARLTSGAPNNGAAPSRLPLFLSRATARMCHPDRYCYFPIDYTFFFFATAYTQRHIGACRHQCSTAILSHEKFWTAGLPVCYRGPGLPETINSPSALHTLAIISAIVYSLYTRSLFFFFASEARIQFSFFGERVRSR